jgi:dolichol-phosphate mannosyltransferase
MKPALAKISNIIPARDEAGCGASTVRHPNLELKLHNVPHEILVVDNGSTDTTWAIFTDLAKELPELRPVQNTGRHGFGCAIIQGLDTMTGDAAVIMMADESDDCRDVVRYRTLLKEMKCI